MKQVLKVRNNPKNLFNVRHLKKEFRNLEKDLININEVWSDVQKLNYLADYSCQKYCSESSDIAQNILNNSDVIAKDFYFHFSIVYKLLEKINKETKNKQIKCFFKEFKKKFETKIQTFHNNVVKHREYSDFRHTIGSTSLSTFYFSVLTENGEFEIDPFIDAKKIGNNLLKLKKIIEK